MLSKKIVTRYMNHRRIEYRLPDNALHREDGPAYVFEHDNGDRYEVWAYNDKIHRYGGPARTSEPYLKEYWIHDIEVTKEVEEWLSERNYVWKNMSDIEKWELEIFMRSL